MWPWGGLWAVVRFCRYPSEKRKKKNPKEQRAKRKERAERRRERKIFGEMRGERNFRNK
jgi:hypothetical protein